MSMKNCEDDDDKNIGIIDGPGVGDGDKNVFTIIANSESESQLLNTAEDDQSVPVPPQGNPCRIVSLCSSSTDSETSDMKCEALVHIPAPAGAGVPYFDMLGNKIAFSILREKRDLDFVLSWLSTLGGACSALGDKSHDWALEAGRISLKQLKIGMKLQDPLITARCQLYIAISCIQRGKLREGKQIVENVYHYVKYQLPENSDPKLIRMCLGIWAKLKYHWDLEREQKLSHLEGQGQGGPNGSSNGVTMSKNLKAICL